MRSDAYALLKAEVVNPAHKAGSRSGGTVRLADCDYRLIVAHAKAASDEGTYDAELRAVVGAQARCLKTWSR